VFATLMRHGQAPLVPDWHPYFETAIAGERVEALVSV
jgi:hypothetical protein